MSSRRAWVMLLVIAIGTLILFSTLFFTGNSNDVTPTKKPTTNTSEGNSDDKIHELTMNVHMEEEEFEALTSLTQTFEKKNPTIQINLTNLIPAENQTYYEALKLRAQLARMSDLTLMDSNWIEEFAALGYLDDVDDHFIKVPVEQYVGSLLSPLKWNGFYWGVPFDFNPYVLTYRDEVVKQFGFNEPAGNLVKWNIQLDRINGVNNRKSEAIYLNADDPYQLLVLDSVILSKATGYK
jgi:ABC-type glycerol-3-phosphate transport system substrate-binding protein